MEISEDWIRSLTGWKPFKEGKAMADEGLVSGFKRTGPIHQGSIREGRTNLRPTVKVVGPSDVRVQCACPEHRATGGICAHAVAVLLTGLKTSAPLKREPPAVSSKQVPRAWDLRLSPRIESEMTEGKLSVRLIASTGAITASDAELGAWLEERKLGSGSEPIALRLTTLEAGDFLDRVAGHPRVEIEGRAEPFQIEAEPGAPLRLQDSRLEGSQVALELAAHETRRKLVRWGDSAAVVNAGSVHRLPGRPDQRHWFEQARKLAENGRLKLALDEFLIDFDAWMDLLEPPQPGWLGTLRLASADPDFELYLDGSLEALDAVVKVRYPGLSARPLPEAGESLAGLPRLAPDGHLLARNPAAEDRARRRLLATGFQPSSGHSRFRLTGRERILGFIADDLANLRQRWTVREGDRLATVLQRVHVVRPDIQQTADFGSSLEFDLSFQTTGGKRLPGGEIRRILRGGKRSIKLPSGSDLVVSRMCEELVSPLVDELGIVRPDEKIRLSGAASILFRNLREKLQESHSQSSAATFEGLECRPIEKDGLNVCLRGYQTTGAEWLAARLDQLGGALLAEEMGLGKTIQTIAAINHFKHLEGSTSGLSLIVVPTSLLGNWMVELERFAPRLKCLLFHGSGRDDLRDRVSEQDVIVTSYGTLIRDLAFHLKREYRLIVADEASLLRNPDAGLSKALVKLRAKGRVALTGTPVENRMQDLWAIFQFIAPGYLGDRRDFRDRYEVPASAGDQVSPALLDRLRLRVSPFVLRRTKDQVAKDLPDKVEVDEWLTLPDDQARFYATLARAGLEEVERVRDQQGEGAGRMHLLTLLLRLRQVCVDPGLLDLDETEKLGAVKMDRLFELLEERADNGKKTLVFSQFARNLRRIEKRIPNGYGRVFCIDGSTRNRQDLVDAFQVENGPAVFLISLKAGGYGLNLTAADAVVHLDPWWNPAVEAQATDRAHRIGQSRPVTVYRLLTRDTVEERVRRMQDRKRGVIDAATGDADVPQNWTREELEGLLR